MSEVIKVYYGGEQYEFRIVRSGNSNDRVDFLLQPANSESLREKLLINANEIWFMWRKEQQQFFTTNVKVALSEELFHAFSNAIMKYYLFENRLHHQNQKTG